MSCLKVRNRDQKLTWWDMENSKIQKFKNVKPHFLWRKQPKRYSFVLVFSIYETQIANFDVQHKWWE